MNVLSFTTGLGTGVYFTNAAQEEEATKKGKNDYLSSAFQAAEISSCSTVGRALCSNPLLKAGITTISLTSWVACPVFAAVKQQHFTPIVNELKTKVQIAHYLPSELSLQTQKIARYLADHIGILSKVVMTGGTLLLPFVGGTYLAVGIAVPLGYQFIDKKGLVPRKISLEVEKYLPTLAMAGALVADPVSQAFGTLFVLSFFPGAKRFMHENVDRMVRHFIKIDGPTLEDINKELVPLKKPFFSQMVAILETSDENITLNPAHFSKPVLGFNTLPQEKNFTQFLNLFEKIDWTKKYHLLKRTFSDDERYLDFLKNTFDHPEDIKELFESYLEKLVEKEKQPDIDTKEKLLAHQLKKQMKALVSMLNGERRAEGNQKDADEAIHYCSQILHYLMKLDLKLPYNLIILEDFLMKLGIDGGEYCALGVKIASKQIVDGLIHDFTKENFDPLTSYEKQLQLRLEEKRRELVDCYYLKFVEALVSGIKDKQVTSTDTTVVNIVQDVHTLSFYRLPIAWGVIPQTEHERSAIGIPELELWLHPDLPFASFRQKIYMEYAASIDAMIKELGTLDFAIYMRAVIENNPHLNAQEKETLLEMFTECNEGKWSAEETEKRFNRLALVMLGVLNYREKLEENWIVVEDDRAALPETQEEEWVLIK